MIKKGQKKAFKYIMVFYGKIGYFKSLVQMGTKKISFILLAQTNEAFAHKKMQANEIV